MKLGLAASLALCLPALCADAVFQPLFNGRNLDGWEVDAPGIWSVHDGMIVGKTKTLDFNDFLRTRRSYSDFILKVKFRLVNNEGNSGVQFRSQAVPGSHEVSGYQADCGQNYWGSLYDESRRKKTLVPASADALAGVDKSAWNEYTITAKGKHISLDLNGQRTVDYIETDPGIEPAGFIALQVHRGFAMEADFKDIRVLELK